jgi:hypothetical protein
VVHPLVLCVVTLEASPRECRLLQAFAAALIQSQHQGEQSQQHPLWLTVLLQKLPAAGGHAVLLSTTRSVGHGSLSSRSKPLQASKKTLGMFVSGLPRTHHLGRQISKSIICLLPAWAFPAVQCKHTGAKNWQNYLRSSPSSATSAVPMPPLRDAVGDRRMEPKPHHAVTSSQASPLSLFQCHSCCTDNTLTC